MARERIEGRPTLLSPELASQILTGHAAGEFGPELLAAMDSARAILSRDALEIRPPGFFSATEYAKQYGIPFRTAKAQLDRAVEKSAMKKIRAYYRHPGGYTKLGVLYGLADGSGRERGK